MASENILQTIQRIMTSIQRLDTLIEEHRRFETRMSARLDRIEQQVVTLRERVDARDAEVRERLTRLETAREADHARIETEIAHFRYEVERAVLRLTDRGSAPPLAAADSDNPGPERSGGVAP